MAGRDGYVAGVVAAVAAMLLVGCAAGDGLAADERYDAARFHLLTGPLRNHQLID
ncbi:hypothetical protein Bcav_1582 [Beutenbergia cavernae DSM 12333]|uniref:Uncharacterized protein n=1 Tax=Beutenbergia cavernae (strain ATCC BAA-8 / DSM 12333 / CCUG 43141 / JCM 11478 / NBRC 16432 / NCIMB 13614 / HKI 0122) TaxID=471853 RepID=C5C3D9_BEUC1|nr:hypothetical protein Bcav_1582 [Beutenbergia cavernae DSM 12333]